MGSGRVIGYFLEGAAGDLPLAAFIWLMVIILWMFPFGMMV
jgi:hypothetical protein